MLAAFRVAARFGTDSLRLLFTDTIIEDEDLYRFLVEGAAKVYGISSVGVAELAARASSLTPVECGDLATRKAELASIRERAIELIPGLSWIADGRTPWEVFEAERYIGNTRADPCSKILKRRMADRWRRDNCDPSDTAVYFGFYADETNRHARALTALGDEWQVGFPLTWGPPCYDAKAEVVGMGLRLPRLYAMGFDHNNCGGFCVKSGQKQFKRLLDVMPERYRYHEAHEQAARVIVGDESILRDRRASSASRRLTLQQFRQRLQRQPDFYDANDVGECSCFAPTS
jgi:hypothetical protein